MFPGIQNDPSRLRKDLEDYFGTAMFSSNPLAVMDLQRVQNASPAELRTIALQNGFDPDKYDA
jgi:hypothetical protein